MFRRIGSVRKRVVWDILTESEIVLDEKWDGVNWVIRSVNAFTSVDFYRESGVPV